MDKKHFIKDCHVNAHSVFYFPTDTTEKDDSCRKIVKRFMKEQERKINARIRQTKIA